MTTMPTQPSGQRSGQGDTATLTAGVNPAAAPRPGTPRSCLALAVSAAHPRTPHSVPAAVSRFGYRQISGLFSWLGRGLD